LTGRSGAISEGFPLYQGIESRKMFENLTELLGYARKLLPLLEIYTGRRQSHPMRDPATHEFQSYAAEVLRANQAHLLELRAVVEGVHQRLRVVDEQSAALQRELTRIGEQHRTLMIAVVIAAVASVGALVAGIIAISHH
jgi:hypothetical protein